MIVFDTDIVTLLTYGRTDKLKARIEAVPNDEVLAVTVLTLMQILGPRYDSIYKAANADEMRRAIEGFRSSKEVLDGFQVLYHTDDSYRRFEELTRAKKSKKKKKDRADMMIAGIVLAHDALLVARNTKDYEGIAGLRMENWAD
jgi:predicted nucleic acid-binding protein